MTKKLTSHPDWSPQYHLVRHGRALLDEGTLPCEVSIDAFCAETGVSKGSFYTHFKEKGVLGWYGAVLDDWADSLIAQGTGAPLPGIVTDPLQVISLIAAHARKQRTAPALASVTRWAAAAGSRNADIAAAAALAAAALKRATAPLTADLTAALTDLGLDPAKAAAMAAAMLPRLGSRRAFDALLATAADAARAALGDLQPAEIENGDGLVLVLTAPAGPGTRHPDKTQLRRALRAALTQLDTGPAARSHPG